MSGVVIEVFPCEGRRFVVEFAKQDVGVHVGCAGVYLCTPIWDPIVHDMA
jgi:hypothetical protein